MKKRDISDKEGLVGEEGVAKENQIKEDKDSDPRRIFLCNPPNIKNQALKCSKVCATRRML